VEIIERGVLDNFTNANLNYIIPKKKDTVLVSKLKNGEPVRMSKKKIVPQIQNIIDELNHQQVDLIVLACTGSFELFNSKALVVYPDFLISKVVNGLLRKKTKLNIIIPEQNQIESNEEKWKKEGIETISECCSPYNYSDKKMLEAIRNLNSNEEDIILLDCIGYTEQMKKTAEKESKKKIILSRDIVFQNVASLF